MRKPTTVAALTELGRVRLSKSFFMRDMLHSEIAEVHGLLNAPDDPDLAVEVGTRLCEELLEPLQERWGVMRIRSAYRSPQVNALGNRMQREGKQGYNCATNEKNAGYHIWDRIDANGCKGATACVVLPAFHDLCPEDGGWRVLARWIDKHLDFGSVQFYPWMWAFNIQWHERPERRIDSFAEPKGRWTPTATSNFPGVAGEPLGACALL
ncbi:MAG TPA: hypothetical protein VFW39_12180 [Sphingomicrobium sp.]|nr:hypothetical protein [Sphingomicrobium sp.]